MKKHLIAAAVAGALAVPAMAQVSISGRLDVGYSMYEADDDTDDLKQIANNSDTTSRITFKASEDLGGGLKAGLVLEEQISESRVAGRDASTFATKGFSRGQYLTLSGSFGGLLIGYANSVSKDIVEGYQASGATNVLGTVHSMLEGHDSRNWQARFTSPSMSGLTVRAALMSENANENDTGSGYDVGIKYKAGPIDAMVGYRKEANTQAYDTTQTSVGIAANAGVAKLFATYTDIKEDAAAASIVKGIRNWIEPASREH